MGNTVGVAIVEAPPDDFCDRCSGAGPCAAITLWHKVDDTESLSADGPIRLCPLCLAEALGLVTGYKVKALVQSWETLRALAVERRRRQDPGRAHPRDGWVQDPLPPPVGEGPETEAEK